MFVTRCPHCRAELDAEDADRGHKVQCPTCGDRFVADPPGAPAAKPVAAKRAAPKAARWDDDSDYANDTAIPPRHWVEREDDGGPDPLRLARRQLAGPAIGLMWTGWVGFILLIVVGFLVAITGFLDMNSPYGSGMGPVYRLALGAVAATLGSMYFAMIATGGQQMSRVRNRGKAVSTAVMGILTMLTCTPVVPLAWAGCGFGIWALMVLNRPEVVDAFERRKRKE